MYRRVKSESSSESENSDDENELKKKNGSGHEKQCQELCRVIFAGSVIVAATTAILYAVSRIDSTGNNDVRVNCHPNVNNATKDICLERGCSWVSTDDDDHKTPLCFFPDGYGYKWVEAPNKTDSGYIVDLQRTLNNTMFGSEVYKIQMQIFVETPTRLRIKITDPSNSRYEVPIPVSASPQKSADSTLYNIEFENEPQFGIKIRRRDNNETILDTNVPGMIFSDQYLQISTKLPSTNIYGLGEHKTDQYRHSVDWKRWTFFARDEAPLIENNLYGVHPFYMNVENTGNTHGVFLHNSNAMEVELQPYPVLTFRTIGGILDLYVFLGPSPEDVVKQYLEVIGKPVFPPYWALGFQLSRWGYDNISNFKEVYKRNVDKNISLDVMYLDLDYAKDRMMFTYDDVNFKELPQFVDQLHQDNKKLILILDPAIPCNETMTTNYSPLIRGKEMDVFVKLNGSYLEGRVWPGQTYYPDFTHTNATSYWTRECKDFHNIIKYDGLWIDMNEPANFVDGSVDGCEKNKWNNPPFALNVQGSKTEGRLYEKTICMDATQAVGMHYNVHSLYGHYQANITHRALSDMFPSKRPFIVGRSTYSGTSQYEAHWLGDNRSWWTQLQESIPGILEFSIFGFSMTGADICGFAEETTDELCMRWMQVGAFYTFSRNHNVRKTRAQDPAGMNDDVVKASVQALTTRYRLLPHLYTLLYMAHTTGSTVLRPLLHEFPKDATTWDINYQFLWGPSLLISPALFENQKKVDAYFPDGIWYDFYSGKVIKGPGKGENRQLDASHEKVNMHVRGGFILPLQEPASNTVESRKNPMQLLIAPNENRMANGSLFWDDGETELTKEGKYSFLQFYYKQEQSTTGSITLEIVNNNYTDPNNLKFESITVFNQPSVSNVTANDQMVNYSYGASDQVLYLRDLKLDINKSFKITIEYQKSS